MGTVERTESLAGQLADRIGGRANIQAIFGPPISRNEVTVIPVGKVRFGFGGGNSRQNADSGGGGGAWIQPVGYIELLAKDSRFRPIRPPNLLRLIAGTGLLVLALGAARSAIQKQLKLPDQWPSTT